MDNLFTRVKHYVQECVENRVKTIHAERSWKGNSFIRYFCLFLFLFFFFNFKMNQHDSNERLIVAKVDFKILHRKRVTR